MEHLLLVYFGIFFPETSGRKAPILTNVLQMVEAKKKHHSISFLAGKFWEFHLIYLPALPVNSLLQETLQS